MSQLSILSGLKAGSDITGGLLQLSTGKYAQDEYESQARLSIQESEAEIRNYKTEVETFKASQKSAYLKSGVKIEGTVLDVLDETVRVSQEKISAARASAASQARELRSKGLVARTSGRLAFMAGLTSAAETFSKYQSPLTGAKSGVRSSSSFASSRQASASSERSKRHSTRSATTQAASGRERGLT